MSSDINSIQQSGGESPQSQVFSAGEVFRAPQQASQFTPPSTPTQPSAPSINQFIPPPMEGASPEINQGVVLEPHITRSPLKAILIIVGIVIVAALIGYGVYYLVNSLQSTPNIPSAPALSALPSPTPAVSPSMGVGGGGSFTHASLIVSPASSEQISLTAITLKDFKTALSALSARGKLLVGTVKDISFSNEVGEIESPVSAEQFISSFFPSAAPQLSFLFEQDFTAWLYGDRVGGNKFGVILQARPEVSAEQLSAALALLEANTEELGNMFVSSVGTAEQVGGFKEGPIDGITVRYLAFSTKNQQVFEYVPVRISGKNYVVIATSYYQMSHMLKLLGAQPISIPVSQ